MPRPWRTGQHALQSASTTFGAGAVELSDGYLSPLPYDGWGVRVTHADRRYLRPGQAQLSSLSRVRVQGGLALNPARTASMMWGGIDYAWGLYWHFRPAAGLQVLAGGTAGAELGVKYLARNVNNPANVDAALDVSAAATVIYDIPLRRRTLRLQADVESPMAGCMFAPRARVVVLRDFQPGRGRAFRPLHRSAQPAGRAGRRVRGDALRPLHVAGGL